MDIKLAVLIDGDNIPSAHVKEMMEEIAKYGNPTIKRIYGDWTKPHLSKWKNMLLENAITPIQQYSYTTGQNSSDSALIIDAMDLLYSKKVDGFCIVSSDSDFTLRPDPGTELTIDLDATSITLPVVGGDAAFQKAIAD